MRRRTLLISLVLLACLTAAIPALANAFGAGCIDEPNDGTSNCIEYHFNEGDFIRFFVEGQNVDGWTTALSWNRTNNVDPTDLDSSMASSHANSDSVIVAADFEFPGNKLADAFCVDESADETICFHWHLRMDTSKGPFTLADRKHMVCHEEGHAVGLRHIDAQGCVAPGTSQLWSSHDISHINTYYP